MSRVDGSQRTIDWYFPARDDCAICHNEASGFILGVHTRQLNRNFTYGDTQRNQLEVWQNLQYFAADSVQIVPEALPRYPTSLHGEEFSLHDKARAYLEVNCGTCHRLEGSAPGEIDLTRIGDVSKLIGLEPDFGDAGVLGAKIIVDGDPEKSLLWIRMSRADEYHMPFVSSNQIDQLAVQLIGDWIRQGVSQQELGSR